MGVTRYYSVPCETEAGILKKHADTDSLLMTDTAGTLRAVGREFLDHASVDHSKSEIEGAFSHFDRMVVGIYHSITPRHMQAYFNELGLRYTTVKLPTKCALIWRLRW
jgi:hypothetical protein